MLKKFTTNPRNAISFANDEVIVHLVTPEWRETEQILQVLPVCISGLRIGQSERKLLESSRRDGAKKYKQNPYQRVDFNFCYKQARQSMPAMKNKKKENARTHGRLMMRDHMIRRTDEG